MSWLNRGNAEAQEKLHGPRASSTMAGMKRTGQAVRSNRGHVALVKVARIRGNTPNTGMEPTRYARRIQWLLVINRSSWSASSANTARGSCRPLGAPSQTVKGFWSAKAGAKQKRSGSSQNQGNVEVQDDSHGKHPRSSKAGGSPTVSRSCEPRQRRTSSGPLRAKGRRDWHGQPVIAESRQHRNAG